MKIGLTGGGTGGHYYPLIAVAEAIHDIADERTLIEPQLFYLGPQPFDSTALHEHDIVHVPISAGSIAGYKGMFGNIGGVFKIVFGIIRSTFTVFRLYPDVIFSTGGYAAFPTLLAARLWRIPVVIYDADAAPGKVSLWSAKFAQWIAVAHPDAANAFPAKYLEKTARTGHPIRREIESPATEGGHEFLKLDRSVPTIFVMGGSSGAQAINNALLNALTDLVERYNVIHQTGRANLEEVEGIANVALINSLHQERYRPFGLLNTLALRMAASVTDVIVARAGSGTIFEIASWGIPSILIPLPLDVSHDQTENAFSYARSGGAVVLEQRNLSPHLLTAEIDRLVGNKELRERMSAAAKSYARPNAARKIAEILIETAISHESK